MCNVSKEKGNVSSFVTELVNSVNFNAVNEV